MPLHDVRPRQYEDNNLTPAALAFFAEFDGSRPLTPATSPPPAPLDPPAEVVTDVIITLLDGRLDALVILRATAARLGFNILPTMPGPAVLPPDYPDVPIVASLDDLAASFARWRDQTRCYHRLLKLASSFRASRRSSPGPRVISTSTWAERDAALRAEAVSLPSSTSTASDEQPEGLPFTSAADLPAELGSSKDHAVIRSLLSSLPDLTLVRWRRRTFFTADNWAEWAKWSRTSNTHRDCIETGRVFLDPTSVLIAPDLRSADAETAADAWHVYRRHLSIIIRQALTVGFPWPEILARLSTTLADPRAGYPRLLNHITAALGATTLLKYPLLHADVLFYKLDCSYASGSQKYSSDSTTIEWDFATSRQPGEDPASLAVRVINAFLMKQDDASLTDVTVWSRPTYVKEINNRYAQCLLNDEADPPRGASSAAVFRKAWYEIQNLYEISEKPAAQLSCEYIAHLYVMTHESVRADAAAILAEAHAAEPQPSAQPPPQLSYSPHPTGRGARIRRDAARAHLQTHHEEPPPQAY